MPVHVDRVEKPVGWKKKSKTPKEVPELGDPDRKRVLNVLAQRRYRERRRAKIAALEAQAQSVPEPSAAVAVDAIATPHVVYGTQDPHIPHSQSDDLPNPLPAPFPSLDESETIEEIIRDTMPQAETGFPPMDAFDQDVFDMQLLEDISFGLPETSLTPRSREHTPRFTPSSSPSSLCSMYPLSPDGGTLEVPVLSTTKAFVTIATMLGIMNKVWDPFYLHTVPPIASPSVPLNLHPTTAQMTIPHHPFLDALPWPSVREKLICMFSLPSACRPPVAQDDDEGSPSNAIMRLVTDLDDHQDGARIHGNMVGWSLGNELEEEAWEIGEVFYKNWWWCLDGKVIAITNRRRRERGLRPLLKMY